MTTTTATHTLTYSAALLDAQDLLLAQDPSVYLIGLGVPDPKGIFGTTTGLAQKYGSNRVMDMPTSENAMTGIGIGSALGGMRPIMTHQRVDFFLLALDQLINNAAKWDYMFAGQGQVPIVFRLIIGKGWGQGPQHSQTLHSLFAHIPGLKVVMPASSYDAKGLLISASRHNGPVVFLEHRWLHNTLGVVPEGLYEVPIGKGRIVKEGSHVTIAALSYLVLEAQKAAHFLEEQGISVELIDLRSARPLDRELLLQSVRKTGRLVVADPDWKSVGFAAEVMSTAVEGAFSFLKAAPRRITYPDGFTPTSWKLAKRFYPTYLDIAKACAELVGKPHKYDTLKQIYLTNSATCDTPDETFKGPF